MPSGRIPSLIVKKRIPPFIIRECGAHRDGKHGKNYYNFPQAHIIYLSRKPLLIGNEMSDARLVVV